MSTKCIILILMHRFTTYLTHKVATHNMNTVIRITATIRPKGSACRGSLASEIFNFEIVRCSSSHSRFFNQVKRIAINLIFLTMIIGYIILMIFINTDVNLMSTCLVSRFAWQGWVTKFKLRQDSMLTPWHTIRTVVNWRCIWFIGLVDDWIFFVHLKSRLWNAFVKTEVKNIKE